MTRPAPHGPAAAALVFPTVRGPRAFVSAAVRAPRALGLRSLGLAALALAALGLAAPPAARAAAAPPLAAPGSALEGPLSDVLWHTTFVPSTALYAEVDARAAAAPPPVLAAGTGAVTLVDEVVVMEGDDEIVTSFGSGQYGLRFDNQVQNPIWVVRRFLDAHPDEFDFVVVWTTFWDYGADGLAYYVGVRQTDAGIGQPKQDSGWTWGSKPGGRLQGFLNMKSIELYGNIADPDNFAYPVMGQEMTHRWLAFMGFRLPSGEVSDAMLGRDAAHWSALLQAYGSVQDGNWWQDNGDGTFRNLGTMVGFSPLDLYGMGLYAADEVEPWFLIENATSKGKAVSPLSQINPGATIQGTRRDITIDAVIAAHGPRVPAAGEARSEFRVATILVTRPGETAAEAGKEIAAVAKFNEVWTERFETWTQGRARVCMRVSADCDAASLRLVSATARELEGDGDGTAEPGETVAVDLVVTNPGELPTGEVTATAEVGGAADVAAVATAASLGALAPGETRELPAAFVLTVGRDAPCGEDATVALALSDGAVSAAGKVAVPLGLLDVFADDFEADLGWTVDPEGTDTAVRGTWERAKPVGVDAGNLGLDVQTQPATDARGGGAAYVTGPLGGELGAHDLDEGVTTLQSPPIDVSDQLDPHLAWWSWHVALDFNDPSGYLKADDNDVLTVELSPDGGATWLLVLEDRSNEQAWQRRAVRLLDLLDAPPSALVLRFTARDVAPQSLSEAGVDGVQVYDFQPTCYGVFPEPPDPEPVDPGDPGVEPGEGPGDGPDPGTVGGDPAGDGAVQELTDGEGRSSGGCGGAPEAGGPWLSALALLGWAALRRRRAGIR